MNADAELIAPPHRFTLTEGVAIAALPAAGYWLAYLYELGYCSYFRIPSSFISINLTTTMGAALALLSLTALFYYVSKLLFHLWEPLPSRFRWPVILFAFMVLVTVFASLFVVTGRRASLLFALGLLIPALILIDFGLPLIADPRISGGYIMDAIARRVGVGLFALIFMLYFLSVLAWGVGGMHARRQTEFLAPAGDSSLVVLRHYGDILIAGGYDAEAMRLTGEIVTIPTNADEPMHFRLERVGRLVPPHLTQSANE